MRIESAVNAAKVLAPWIGLGLATYFLSTLSFETNTGKKIFERDGGICQGLGHYGCFWEEFLEHPASYDTGFHVQSAHYPNLHGQQNENINAGRCLCSICHRLEELLRGNTDGDRVLQDTQSIIAYWFMETEQIEDHEFSTAELRAYIKAKNMKLDYDPRPRIMRLQQEMWPEWEAAAVPA